MKIHKEVREKLNKHNLTPVKVMRTADGSSIRSHLVVAESEKGDRFAIKLFDSDDKFAKERFLRELKNIQKLRSLLPPKYRSWLPSIKWSNSKGDNPHYIYRFIEAEPIGRFVHDFGIKWGLFGDKNFQDFIGFFGVISDVSHKEFSEDDLGSWSYRTSIKELQYYFENVPGLLPSGLYDEIRSFVDNSQKRVFAKRTLSHRDLYPENILLAVKKSSKFSFLDWEYLSRVPIGFDAAFLYLLFWREEYWKAKVLSYYYNKYEKMSAEGNGKSRMLADFRLSFRFCLILLAIRFLYQLETFGDKSSDQYEHARQSFLYDMESALDGEVVKPRNVKFFICLEDIKKVANKYNINDVKNYEIFYASKGNTVAKVVTESGKKYIFRFYSQSRSKTLILRELKILELLGEAGVPTYKIMHGADGELYTEHTLYGKKRKVAILSYLEGKKLHHRYAKEAAIGQAGRALRFIHDSNVVHGDYSKENVLFIREKLSGVIDFEWGRITKSRKAKFHDLSKAVALWLIDIRAKSLSNPEMIKEFLRGYYGKDLSDKKQLKALGDTIKSKIETEMEIFLTTIDISRVHREGGKLTRRFDSAITDIDKFLSIAIGEADSS